MADANGRLRDSYKQLVERQQAAALLGRLKDRRGVSKGRPKGPGRGQMARPLQRQMGRQLQRTIPNSCKGRLKGSCKGTEWQKTGPWQSADQQAAAKGKYKGTANAVKRQLQR